MGTPTKAMATARTTRRASQAGRRMAASVSSADVLVIHGTYHFGRRILAFRNDYCLTCAGPRLANLHRTFDVLHVFWLPILPLGSWSRWKCGTCGSNPHARAATSRALKWAGIACLVIGSVVFWAAPADRRLGRDNDPAMIWT